MRSTNTASAAESISISHAPLSMSHDMTTSVSFAFIACTSRHEIVFCYFFFLRGNILSCARGWWLLHCLSRTLHAFLPSITRLVLEKRSAPRPARYMTIVIRCELILLSWRWCHIIAPKLRRCGALHCLGVVDATTRA